MLFLNILLLHHALHSTVKAAAIDNNLLDALPAGDASTLALRDTPTKEIELYVERSSTTDLEARSTTTEIGTYVNDRQITPEVIIAGIQAVEKIVIAACAATLTCLIVCGTIVLAGYFAYKIQTSDSPSYQGGTFTPTQRDIDEAEFTYHSAFEPTADCGLRCQLHTKLPEGEWTHTGNATLKGHVHQIHHFIKGTTIGIRAYQKNSAAVSKRNPYDQEDYESVVADYYWNFGTSAAYNDFHSTTSEINAAGDDVGGYLYYNNYIAACVDFEDSTGLLDDGVIAVGWNDQPYIWNSQSALDNQISQCNIGNLLHGGIVPGPTQENNL